MNLKFILLFYKLKKNKKREREKRGGLEIETNEEALCLGIGENKSYSMSIPPSLHANCKQATRPSKEGRQLAGATPAAVLGPVTGVGYIAKWQLGTSKGTSRK